MLTNQTVAISWAEDSDNQQILNLSARCVQTGMVSVYPDRSPVYNRIHRLLDPDSYHAIAKAGDRVVGLLGTLHLQLYFQEVPLSTAYWMDFRVDPDFRHGLTAFRMIKPTVEREKEAGTRVALATLLKNNEAPMVFTKGRGGFPASLYLGDNRIFNIIPIRHLKPDSRFVIDNPSDSDIPQLVDLYNRFYGSYRLAPRMTEALLRHYISHIDGLGLDRFWVARQNGRIKAVLAAWDEEPFKRFWVIRKSFSISMVTGIIRLISLFTRMPARISIKQPLPQMTLVLYAHDHSTGALKALIRHVNNQNLGGKYSLIQIHMHENDPAQECLKGLAGVAIRNEIHLFTDTLQLAREIQNAPGSVHLEFPAYI